jgi:hypothetical protein
MSGLEFVRGLADRTLPLNMIAQALGYDVIESTKGRVVVTVEPSDAHLNPCGTMHGGLTATLLDSCMGLAVQSTRETGRANHGRVSAEPRWLCFTSSAIRSAVASIRRTLRRTRSGCLTWSDSMPPPSTISSNRSQRRWGRDPGQGAPSLRELARRADQPQGSRTDRDGPRSGGHDR